MAEYIEREAALVICEKEYQERIRMSDWCGDTVAWNIGHEIKAIPSADVAPVRHGRWNEESPDCLDGDSVYVCSVCGETWTLIEGTPLDNNMHYCPNCGADMREDKPCTSA